MTYSLEKKTIGSANKNSKLTEAQVIEMRRLHAEEACGYKLLARKYGIHVSTVRGILGRHRWKHV